MEQGVVIETFIHVLQEVGNRFGCGFAVQFQRDIA